MTKEELEAQEALKKENSELKAKLTASESAITKSSDDLEKTRNESAKYRVGRNDALRRSFALEHILKAHNINIPENLDTSGLSIEDGKAQGDFSYTPPKAEPKGAKRDDDKTKLTLVDVQKMTPEQIDENWDDVQALMSSDPFTE